MSVNSTRTASPKYYFSSKTQPLIASGLVSPRIDKLNTTTEDQQARIRKLIEENRKGNPLGPNAALISQSEMQRMKSLAAVMTKDELLQQKRILEEQTQLQQAANMTKKQRMLDIEAEKKKKMPASEVELERRAIDENVRSKAKAMLDEERDDVKGMNKMMLYAKVVTIRDNQLLEKEAIRRQGKTQEKRKDLEMELERLRKIKYYEDQEKRQLEEQKKSAQETVKQIQERELVRKKAQEEIEKEGQDMLRTIQDNQTEDATKNIERKRYQKGLNEQIYQENQVAIVKKQEKIYKEREEEERIHRYNVEKAQKDAEYQAEQRQIRDQKEKEVQRLREMQEKASDRMSEIDALRAKRATEQAERIAREKERKEAESRAKINQELLEARQLQSLEKQKLIQDQAKMERDEFQRIIDTQKFERDVELKMEKEKASRIHVHAEQLKKQIAINEEKKKLDRREFLEQGKQIKDKLNNEKDLLETIKNNKLQELDSLGIENKYSAELARKRIII